MKFENNITKKRYTTSFAQYLIDTYGDNALDLYWDWDKNNEIPINPWNISKCYGKKVWIKCQEKHYHKSYPITCNHFVNNHRCPYCSGRKLHSKDSFAQWGIDNLGEDFLDKYWDYEKNVGIEPWELSCGISKHIYIKCQEKDYHKSYKIRVSHFISGSRCPLCISFHGKIHILDSLGTVNPKVFDYWSDKNETTPYEFSPFSSKEVWWKCSGGLHEDYKRKICEVVSYDFSCPYCKLSMGETKVKDYLDHNNIKNISQKKFKGLIGTKNRKLSYDFYIPDLNLLIEYQGIQHEKPIDFGGKGIEKAKKNFEKQQEHDRRKREYAELHNIKLLEIWYYDYDNIENILNEIINNLKSEERLIWQEKKGR